MDIFDIIGPVMVGPSSSHTAGAVRIGYIARKLMGEPIEKAEILLGGSFLTTGKGHGTDKSIVAGLLGMLPDDIQIPDSFEMAKEKGIEVTFGKLDLKDAHPNTVKLCLTGESGVNLEIVASSLGGGRIKVNQIDGITANFCGDYPTLVVRNQDTPGCVAKITSLLSFCGVNIATMQLYRNNRGGDAVSIIECDQEIDLNSINWLRQQKDIIKVTYLSLADDKGGI